MFSSAIKSFTSNIASNYSIAAQPSSFSGPWKIFDAKRKGSGKLVSVFVFDRKSLEPQGGGFGRQGSTSSLKRAHDEVVDRLKKEASSLARLRHPSILELAEPVEETRSGGLMFATEPVTASLSTVLEDKNHQSGRSSRFVMEEAEDGGRRRKEFDLDELEIQKGLLQVGKGLEFLHESANLVHANLTPEAIFINAKSDWKISGLGFASPPDNATGATSVAPISLAEVLNHDARLPRSVQLNLDYTSPDFILDTNINQSADMFSLGLVVIALYNSPHRSPLETSQSASTYKRIFSTPSSIPTHNNNFQTSANFPNDVKGDLLPKLITRRPAQRYGAREFQQAQYFDNVLVSTMRFLDSFPAKNQAEKSQFMRGLPRILSQFPKSVLEKKILPALLEETKDLDLLTLILQNAFKCGALVSDGRQAVSKLIIPKLREVFLTSAKNQSNDRVSLKEGGLVVVLDNMTLIAKNCTGQQFKEDVLPVIFVGLESPTHSLVDHSLQTLPVILPVLDFSTMKNELFPVVANVFSKTSSMAIKIQGLHALNALCGGSTGPAPDVGDGLDGFKSPAKSSVTTAVLDKFTTQEKIVPLLRAIKTKEPAVMMAALSVFQQVGRVADADFLAMQVLPCLWSFSLGPLLNLEQFQQFMKLIKSLSNKIEQEQTRKLSEFSSTSTSHRAGSTSFGGSVTTNGFSAGSNTGGEDGDFESLVTGRGRNTQNDDLFNAGWTSNTAVRPANSRTASSQMSSGYLTSPVPRGSGSVTPDNLGSFAAMTPSQSSAPAANPWGQPLQPQTQMQSPPMQPMQATSHMAGTSVDWSRASRNTSSVSMNSMSRNPSINQVPQPSNTGYSGFSIAPPPMSPTGPMNVQLPGKSRPPHQQQQTKQQQGQGLDRYESLI